MIYAINNAIITREQKDIPMIPPVFSDTGYNGISRITFANIEKFNQFNSNITIIITENAGV